MTDSDQERLYEDYWLRIENLLSIEQTTNFLLDYLNFKQEGFVREADAYDSFKHLYQKDGFTNESMLSELLRYAEFYHEFISDHGTHGEIIRSRLKDLRQLKQTTVYLFLFHLFEDLSKEILTEEEAAKVLSFLLYYSIRRIACEIGSNSLRGLYKTLYARVFNNPQNRSHYYDSIVSFFQQLASKDALPSDEDFTAALLDKNLYNKRALCKFLLCSIENQGKEQLLTGNMTIEHILPQNKNLSAAWQNMLGDNWQINHEKYVNTLGNLTLTGYNSELGDLPFDEKKKKLEDFHTKVIRLYEDVKSSPVWDLTSIQKRAKHLVEIILTLFTIQPPENQISFADPRLAEYSCDDPGNATHKIPCYYVLLGERVTVNNYADMLRSLLDKLYDRNHDLIEEMARNNEKLHYAQYPLFSYDASKTRYGKEIQSSGIFESSGFSAQHIITIIQIMLEKYDLDRQDFLYGARSNIDDAGEILES